MYSNDRSIEPCHPRCDIVSYLLSKNIELFFISRSEYLMKRDGQRSYSDGEYSLSSLKTAGGDPGLKYFHAN